METGSWPRYKSQPVAKLSTGFPSIQHHKASSKPITNNTSTIRVSPCRHSEAFPADPTITYLLFFPTPNQRLAYCPIIFRVTVTTAAANNAIFDERHGWKSCGVMFPLSSAVDRLGPSLYPIFISVAWSIEIRGCQASLCHLPKVATLANPASS